MKWTALAACLLLTACGGSSAPERYTLTPQPLDMACHSAGSIKIFEPEPAPGLDSTRVVVIDRPNHRTHYQGVAWVAPSSQMVQNYLADSLEQSGMFTAVGTEADSLSADYELESKLRSFEVDLTGEPRIVIRLTATLIRGDGGYSLTTFRLNREMPIGGADMQGIVAMFNEQMHSMAQELAASLRITTGCH